ncbi:hypothetical protein Kyoto84A_14330 [Helicobacter pylori]
MRQKNETATSLNQLKEITQSIQAIRAMSETHENANTSELTPKEVLKPKAVPKAKQGAVKPTKRAFSEREKTTIRDTASDNACLENKQTNQNKRKPTKGVNHEA